MEDSLENMSSKFPQRKSVSPSIKEEKEKALLHQLKQKFIFSLSKLQLAETREIGMSELRFLIDRNREPEHIQLFLSLMRSLKREGTSSSTKEHEILVFSFLAEILKENLVDQIDKLNPSPIKTCFRIVETLHGYFTDNSGTVQQACARVLIDLGKHVLGIEGENPSIDIDTYLAVVFVPLTSILKNGVDKASQATASVCINEFVQYWKINAVKHKKYEEILRHICESSEILNVGLKLNCEYSEIFIALNTLIEIQGLEFFNGKIFAFVNKILGVINKINNSSTPENQSNLNAYMCKVSVCEILERIGALIRDKPDLKNKLEELDVKTSLEKAGRNRILQVQTAASRALKVWNGEILKPKDQRSSINSTFEGKGNLMSLEEARNNKKKSRSSSKEGKLHLEKELNHIQDDLSKLVKGGWGAHNRANKYVKKNSGVGGGYNNKMEERDRSASKSPGKSHKEHIEELRKFIKDSSKEHSTKDKFIFYEEKSNKKIPREIEEANRKDIKYKAQSNKKIAIEQRTNNREESVDFELMEDEGDQMVNIPTKTWKPLKKSEENYPNPYVQMSEVDSKKGWLLMDPAALEGIDGVNGNTLGAESSLMDTEEMKQLLQEEEEVRLGIQSKQNIQSRANVDMSKKAQNYQEMTFNKVENSQQIAKKETIFDEKVGRGKSKNVASPRGDEKNNNGFLIAGMEGLDLEGYDPNEESIKIEEILSESDFKGQQWNPYQIQENINNKTNNISTKIEELSRNNNEKRNESNYVKQTNFKDSLSLSNSLEDNVNSEFKKQQNVQPIKSKFNSFNNDQVVEDIEEEILDESQYEESYQAQIKHKPEPFSKPKELPHKITPNEKIQELYNRSVQHGKQLDQNKKSHIEQNELEIYQELIKNPPRSHVSHRLDKVSEISAEPHQEEEEENMGENIIEKWKRVLEFIEANEINEAYSLALDMDDPIYLLRLMLMTQTPLGKLTPLISSKLWAKFLEIYQHKFIDNIFVQMFSSFNTISGGTNGRGISRALTIEEVNDLLIELYELSGRTKGKLSFSAATLYNEVEGSINSNK